MTRTLTLLVTTAAFALAVPALAQQGDGVPGLHFIENWDDDGDGQVTLAEATQRRDDIFFMFDNDDNSVLDAAEYDVFDQTRADDMAVNGHGMGPADEGMARQVADADGNGEVTKDEFLSVTPAWFARMDRNGDGVITTDDFGPRRG